MAENLNEPESTVDFREIIKIIKKYWKLIFSFFLVSALLGILIVSLIPNTYQAEAKLRIKQSKGLADSLLADLPSGNVMAGQQLIATYAEIIKSRAVVTALIKNSIRDAEATLNYEQLVQRIVVAPVKNTEIMQVKVQAKTATEAMQLTNALVEVFLKRLTELARAEQTSVKSFIGERLNEAKLELAESENNLKNYKKLQKIIAPQEETKALVERLTEVNRLTANNHIEVATIQAKLAGIKRQMAEEKVEYIATNPLIEQMRAKLAELEVRLVGYLQKYTANHPEVSALNAEIEETKTKLNQEIKRVVNIEAPSQNKIHQELLQQKMQAEVELGATMAQKAELDQIITSGESQIAKLPTEEQNLARLMRDTALAQEIYIMLAKRYEEAQISEAMQPTDVQIIDQATTPNNPIKPKRKMNVLLTAFIGLFIGIGLAFLMEYFNKTINSIDDVKSYLDLPVLAAVPDYVSLNKYHKK